MNNLTDIANTCSKYRPTSLEDSHNGKFLTKLINENINPKTKQLNTEQLENIFPDGILLTTILKIKTKIKKFYQKQLNLQLTMILQ